MFRLIHRLITLGWQPREIYALLSLVRRDHVAFALVRVQLRPYVA
jgi:hypothetical protein